MLMEVAVVAADAVVGTRRARTRPSKVTRSRLRPERPDRRPERRLREKIDMALLLGRALTIPRARDVHPTFEARY
jgi:hypothetical protein